MTRANFLGVVTMVTLQTKVVGNPVDDDAQRLYGLMNVPPQDSFMGPGKAVKTADQVFTLSCALRGGDPLCSIVIKAGSTKTVVSPSQQLARFTATGEEAAELYREFIHNQPDGSFFFQTTDAFFTIRASETEFVAEYHHL